MTTDQTTELPGQPDGIEDDSRDVPMPHRAAERVGAYIRATGDGLYDVQDGAPLYGRDLEALCRAAVADTDRGRELERRADEAVTRALELAKELAQLAERHAATQRLHDLWQKSAQNRLRDLSAARDEIRRQDTLFDAIADTATTWTRTDRWTTQQDAGQTILRIIEQHRGARGLGSSRCAQEAGRPVLAEIDAERRAQDVRWGEQNHPHGTRPGWLWTWTGRAEDVAEVARDWTSHAADTGDLTWRDILLEEVAEAFTEDEPAKLRRELVQVAAVAAAWVEAIDRRAAAGEHDVDQEHA